MSVHKKLMQARLQLAQQDLKKTGENKFAGYKYFELGDFLPTAQAIFAELGLCGVVSFTADTATLTITDTEDGSDLRITSPMGSAALKGCHEVQNIGAVETYQRRYLWVSAFEIVEHDALDATTGKAAPEKTVPFANPKIKPTDGAWETQSSESQEYLQGIANQIEQLFATHGTEAAHNFYAGLTLDNEEKIAMWSRVGSKARGQIKKYHDSLKGERKAA